jgi:hypothetical protein
MKKNKKEEKKVKHGISVKMTKPSGIVLIRHYLYHEPRPPRRINTHLSLFHTHRHNELNASEAQSLPE